MESERDGGGREALFAQGNLQGQHEHICEVEKGCSGMLWLKRWEHKCVGQEGRRRWMQRSGIRLLKV